MLTVALAEMGDKTQLLAMAFAARFRWQTVLWAILAATIVNHLLAVTAGSVVTTCLPMPWVKLLASISFLVFSLWTLHDDTAPGAGSRSMATPFMTVAWAFFLAEMGDKTQVMTMILAADLVTATTWTGRVLQVFPVWAGSTAGMMLADAIGIVVGIVFRKKLPTHTIKWVAALIFAFCGICGLHANINQVLHFGAVTRYLSLAGIVFLMAIAMLLISRRAENKHAGRLKAQQCSKEETDAI